MDGNNGSGSHSSGTSPFISGKIKRTMVNNSSITVTTMIAPQRIRVQSQQSLHSIRRPRNNSVSQLSFSDNDYKQLTSRSSVKNLLISLGSARANQPHMDRNTEAAIQIQAVVRRMLVMRRYERKDHDRTLQKIDLLDDINKRRGDYPVELYNSKSFTRYVLPGIKKDFKILTEACRNKATKKHITNRILTILFTSLADPLDYIDDNSMGILLTDILLFPFQKTQIYDSSLNIEIPKSPIYLTMFLNWFYQYNEMYPIEERGLFRKMFYSNNFDDLPTNFICRFSQFRSCLYDIIFTLNKYDQINPCEFTCKFCKKQFVYPLDLGKHIVKYHYCK